MGQWPSVSRGSVSLVFVLVKGEGHSPAHRGICRVGAPSILRPCSSGHANIRAHPPVEPARDHEAHHTIIVQSVPSALTRAARRRGQAGPPGGGAHTPSHPGGAHRECRPADGRSATGFLPENCLQRPTAGAKVDGANLRVFFASRCSALEGVQAGYRLITQRSSVQIRPPQPLQGQGVSGFRR